MLHRQRDEGIVILLCSAESIRLSLPLVGCEGGVVILAPGVVGDEIEMVVP